MFNSQRFRNIGHVKIFLFDPGMKANGHGRYHVTIYGTFGRLYVLAAKVSEGQFVSVITAYHDDY